MGAAFEPDSMRAVDGLLDARCTRRARALGLCPSACVLWGNNIPRFLPRPYSREMHLRMSGLHGRSKLVDGWQLAAPLRGRHAGWTDGPQHAACSMQHSRAPQASHRTSRKEIDAQPQRGGRCGSSGWGVAAIWPARPTSEPSSKRWWAERGSDAGPAARWWAPRQTARCGARGAAGPACAAAAISACRAAAKAFYSTFTIILRDLGARVSLARELGGKTKALQHCSAEQTVRNNKNPPTDGYIPILRLPSLAHSLIASPALVSGRRFTVQAT